MGELKVCVPGDIVGDIMGDLNKRRGRVNGIDPCEDKKGYQIVSADVPKSEMSDYTVALRAMAQGKGSFTYYFVRYEELPAQLAQKVIAEAQQKQE